MTWKSTGRITISSWYFFPGLVCDKFEKLVSALFFSVPTQGTAPSIEIMGWEYSSVEKHLPFKEIMDSPSNE
jgi:hypothetical protein